MNYPLLRTMGAVCCAMVGFSFAASFVQAVPLLSVDFNAGSTGPSPTESGFLSFVPVSTASQAGPLSRTYTSLDSLLSTGSVTVTLAAGSGVTAAGNFTSRDRRDMLGPEFSNYYLYRDLVSSSSGLLTVGISGLLPSRSYQVTIYAYDDSNSRSLSVTNYTSGSAGTVSNLSWTGGFHFNSTTAPGVFSVTQTATSDASGKLEFRVSKTDAINSALISGVSVGAVPATWYLSTSQANADNWSSSYLAHWNSATNGSGSAPSAIHTGDTFINSASGYQLRTSGGASTFLGGELVLSGSAKLILKTSNTAHISTIPRLTTNGGMVEQGYTGIVQKISVGRFLKNSGDTSLSAGSGRGIDLRVDSLTGSSAFILSGGGSFRLKLKDARSFTGSISLSSGTLVVEEAISTSGNLVIAAGTKVELLKPAYFTGVSINGVSLSPGIHTAADLQTSYPTVFSGSADPGCLVVYSTASATMRGVNLAGGEFGTPPGTYGVTYKFPTATHFDYYQGKGLTLMRVPFRWERVQPTLNSALDSTQLGYLDAVVSLAEARGMKIVLDMHNYGRHNGSVIGSVAVPVSAFRDVWRRLADHFRNKSAIYAYGLMNEPHDMGGIWPEAAQEAVNAVREVDANTFVLVSGDEWSAAYGWEVVNAGLDVMDPVQRLVYEAHCYFDTEGGGSYGSYEDEGGYAQIGVDRVRPFRNWLRATGNVGYVGEYGVPRGDARWLVVLDNFLNYLEAEGISGTYWAGGPGWGSSVILNPYSTICEPYSGADAPQMSVIADYP